MVWLFMLLCSLKGRVYTMGLGSLFAKVETWFKGAEVTVSADFVKIFGADAAKQFAAGALALLKTAEGKIVTDAVEAIQTLSPSADGTSKKAQAFEKIVSDFKSQGVTVADSLINTLIELAVGLLKGRFGARDRRTHSLR